MKSTNSSHPNKNGDTSGVVAARGASSIDAPCSRLPRHERLACPDVTGGSPGAVGAAQCATLGCCYDQRAAEITNGSPPCYYYGEARGSPPPCSLNGVKSNGASGIAACICDKGWEGANCERLRLKPANLSEGFNSWSTSAPGTSSWGATQLRGDDGLFHTWVGEMSMSCGIDGYENNMQIVHFTSHERRSGWIRKEPVSPVTSICAHAIRDPATKKYLIFHTGCGDDANPNSHGYGLNTSSQITNCKNGSTPLCSSNSTLNKCKYAPLPPPTPPPRPGGPPKKPTCGIASNTMSIFVSDSPDGPWYADSDCGSSFHSC
jgi:hypothetical protein